MSREQLRELAGAVARSEGRCPCGVPADTDPRFHRRSAVHDCVHHFRRSCGWCRTVARLIAGVEARLYVEVAEGPFEITRWER